MTGAPHTADLDFATAALAEMLGDRQSASWFRKKAQA
jgi:hypothetical protein